MQAIEVMEEILSKVFEWHRFPLLYFKGLSLRKVNKFLLHKGCEVSIENIRKYFHEEPFSQYTQPLYGFFIPDFGEFFKVEVYKVNKECFRLLDLHLTKTNIFWKRNILAGSLR